MLSVDAVIDELKSSLNLQLPLKKLLWMSQFLHMETKQSQTFLMQQQKVGRKNAITVKDELEITNEVS